MKFFQSNIQTSVLVLLVVLLAIVCVALFFTSKEVRHLKTSVVKNQHDIEALQNLLNDVGMKATGSFNTEVPAASFTDSNMAAIHPNAMTPQEIHPNSPLSVVSEENLASQEDITENLVSQEGVSTENTSTVVPEADVEVVEESDSESSSDSDSESSSEEEK